MVGADTLAKFVTRGAQSDIFYEVGSLIARAFRPWFIIAATQRAANRRCDILGRGTRGTLTNVPGYVRR